MTDLTVIVNPISGSGRARGLLAGIDAAFAPFRPKVEITTRPGEEEHFARRAAEGGAETIVVVGGDGTWGNAAHGVISSGASPRVALLAAGTGNDFVKSVGAPAHDAAATARLIASGAERRVDVGVANDRVFLNCLGVGFDTAVLARSGRMHRVRGAGRYLAAALAELFRYRSEPIGIVPWPNQQETETLLAVFANGRWYGGMFHIAPHADAEDGLLDVVRVRDVRGLRRLALLKSAISGAHVDRRGVELASGSEFELSFESPPLINSDGELRRATGTELSIRVLPGALRLVAPPRPDPSERQHPQDE